jgi:hypothetical protein
MTTDCRFGVCGRCERVECRRRRAHNEARSRAAGMIWDGLRLVAQGLLTGMRDAVRRARRI